MERLCFQVPIIVLRAKIFQKFSFLLQNFSDSGSSDAGTWSPPPLCNIRCFGPPPKKKSIALAKKLNTRDQCDQIGRFLKVLGAMVSIHGENFCQCERQHFPY